MQRIDCNTAYDVAVTAELVLTIEGIEGTKTGLARINSTYELPAGLALATYCPADGSVVTVAEGDTLIDYSAPGAGTFHLETINAVPYWVATDTVVAVGLIGSVGASSNRKFDLQKPVWATKAAVRTLSSMVIVGATNDGTDYWTLELSHKAAIVATTSTAGMTASRYVYSRSPSAVATAVITLFVDGAEEAGTANLTQLIYTKVNAPTNLNIQDLGVQLAYIRE